MGHSLDVLRRTIGRLSLGVIYASRLILLITDYLNYMRSRLMDEVNMESARDWLSRLLEMIPVKGTLDYRCFLGAPWRIDFRRQSSAKSPIM